MIGCVAASAAEPWAVVCRLAATAARAAASAKRPPPAGGGGRRIIEVSIDRWQPIAVIEGCSAKGSPALHDSLSEAPLLTRLLLQRSKRASASRTAQQGAPQPGSAAGEGRHPCQTQAAQEPSRSPATTSRRNVPKERENEATKAPKPVHAALMSKGAK